MRTKVNGVVYVTCPDCKGQGDHPVTISGLHIDKTRVKCKVCNGRRKLPEKELEKEQSDVKVDKDSSGS